MKWFITLLLFALPSILFSQDYQYWSEQYGARASLLGGATIAGSEDNTAVYYNPGALGWLESSSISVNATVYKAQLTYLENVAGEGNSDHYTRYVYYPQMLSGMVPIGKNDRYKIGYVLMTRYNDRQRYNARVTEETDVMELIPGDEYYVGAYEFYKSIDEQWGGLGIGYQVSDKIAIGVTQFVSYRYQDYSTSTYVRTIPVVDSSYFLSSRNSHEDLVYYNWRILWKFGISINTDNIDLGFTITTPTVNIFGDNDVQREVSFSNIPNFVGEGVVLDFLAIDRQESLKTHYKLPWSFGAGIRYDFGTTRVSLNMEYFTRIKAYDISPADHRPVIYPPNLYTEELIGKIDFLSVKSKHNAVFNVAVGFEKEMNENIDLLLGARTDFSNFRYDFDTDGIVMKGRSWDLYHLSGGITYKFEKSALTAGLDLMFGYKDGLTNFVNFNDPKDYHGLVGVPEDNMRVIDAGGSFIIGYTYYFSTLPIGGSE
jgi:hypothetical protein